MLLPSWIYLIHRSCGDIVVFHSEYHDCCPGQMVTTALRRSNIFKRKQVPESEKQRRILFHRRDSRSPGDEGIRRFRNLTFQNFKYNCGRFWELKIYQQRLQIDPEAVLEPTNRPESMKIHFFDPNNSKKLQKVRFLKRLEGIRGYWEQVLQKWQNCSPF